HGQSPGTHSAGPAPQRPVRVSDHPLPAAGDPDQERGLSRLQCPEPQPAEFGSAAAYLFSHYFRLASRHCKLLKDLLCGRSHATSGRPFSAMLVEIDSEVSMHRREVFLKYLSNPLEWRSSSKALLVFGVILSLHVYYALIARYVLGLDHPPSLLNIAHVRLIFDATLVWIGLSAVLFLVTSILGRKYRDNLLFEYVAASYYCLSLCYFSYHTGTLSLATGAALAGAPVLGFILFHRGAVLVALVIGVVTLTLLSYASAFGYLPYAPVLQRPMAVDGV